ARPRAAPSTDGRTSSSSRTSTPATSGTSSWRGSRGRGRWPRASRDSSGRSTTSHAAAPCRTSWTSSPSPRCKRRARGTRPAWPDGEGSRDGRGEGGARSASRVLESAPLSLERGGLACLEALLAVDRPALGGAEGNRRLLAALGAGGRGLDPLAGRMVQARVALGLAVLAALGLVLEVLVGVEELLARGPDERLVAFDAHQVLVSV